MYSKKAGRIGKVLYSQTIKVLEVRIKKKTIKMENL